MIRKPNKNMYLYVKPPDGQVVLTMPKEMKTEQAEAFVRAKAAWIAKKQAAVKALKKEEKSYVTGEIHRVWGREYTLLVETGEGRRDIVREEDRLRMHFPAGHGEEAEERRTFLDDWYRKELEGQLCRRVPLWEAAMGTAASGWRIRKMRTRWGSCNTESKYLTFNLELCKKERECLDYIIVHELAHLRIPNHSKEFWNLVGVYVPEWQKIRRKLKH